MKQNKILFLTSLIAAFVLFSCKKNSYNLVDRTTTEGAAQVKLGYFSAYTVLPNTILYINDKPVSNTLAAPISFPGGGFNMGGSSNGDYLLVSPGSVKIQGFTPVPGTGNIASKLFEFTETFNVSTSYTYFITDTGANTKGFSIEDSKAAPDSGFARIKFVNAMPNTAVDLYKGANNGVATLFQTNIAFKGVTPVFDLPVPVSDSFFIRPAGSLATTIPIARRAWAANLTTKRIYTMLARGYNGATATNLAPQLSVIVNQ